MPASDFIHGCFRLGYSACLRASISGAIVVVKALVTAQIHPFASSLLFPLLIVLCLVAALVSSIK